MRSRTRLPLFLVLAVLFTVLLLDAVSPFLLRRDLDAAADAALEAASASYLRTGSELEASSAARTVAVDRRVVLVGFQVVSGGSLRVTVSDDAESYVLGRVPPLRQHYVVEVSRTAPAAAGPAPTAPAPSP